MKSQNELAEPPTRRRLLVAPAMVVVATVRCALVLASLERVGTLVEWLTARTATTRPHDPFMIRDVTGAIDVATSWVPGAGRPDAALAARIILAWAGQPADVRIGVRRGRDGEIEAHTPT